MNEAPRRLVVVGISQILPDLLDCAHACGWRRFAVLEIEPRTQRPRDRSWDERLQAWAAFGIVPETLPMPAYAPGPDDEFILGPTQALRHRLVQQLQARHGPLRWTRLVHPAAHVSRMAQLGAGCFVGAGAVIAAQARLGEHVFVNRVASVGHDTVIDDYARLQPRAAIGGLAHVGRAATLGMGSTVFERVHIGSQATVAGGAVVRVDVPACSLVAGVPAVIKKQLPPIFDD